MAKPAPLVKAPPIALQEWAALQAKAAGIEVVAVPRKAPPGVAGAGQLAAQQGAAGAPDDIVLIMCSQQA